MKLSIDKEDFYKAVNIAESGISSKNLNATLSNCLFNIARDEIEIISTDNEIAIRTRVDAVSDSSMSFIANGKKLSSILKELPSGELQLNISEKLTIDMSMNAKNIKGNFSLIAADAEDYPEIPEFEETGSIEIEQSVLKEMFRKVIYAASHDTIKPVFNGIYILIEKGNGITAVSTDSRRLAMIHRAIDFTAKVEENEGFILPIKTVGEIYKQLESSGNCMLSYNSNQCFFKTSKTEIISRIVDGQFPNYKHVIPKEFIIEASIETKLLLDSVRRVMIFTKEPANKIILHFTKNRLIIEANTPDLGHAEEEIEIESNSDEEMTLGLNAQFLVDALREMDSFSIKCGITGNMSPVTLSPEDDVNYVSVIMPIQIKSAGVE